MGYNEDLKKKIDEIGNCVICGKELDYGMGLASSGLCSGKCHTVQFWNEKIRWKNDNRKDVVRVEHKHFIIGEEED